jgi:hypothetical protein
VGSAGYLTALSGCPESERAMINDGGLSSRSLTEDGLLQRRLASGLRRAHNFAEGEPITSAPTVGRDLREGRSAQRFPLVPW